MLMVSIDCRYLELQLVTHRCEFGVGAEAGLKKLMPNATHLSVLQLQEATGYLNSNATSEFWDLLSKVERIVQSKCQGYP